MNSVNQNLIKPKVRLLNSAADLGSVSLTCKVMSACETFYRCQAQMAKGGVEALPDASRKKVNLPNWIGAFNLPWWSWPQSSKFC
mgnify:CR=1 FL=1